MRGGCWRGLCLFRNNTAPFFGSTLSRNVGATGMNHNIEESIPSTTMMTSSWRLRRVFVQAAQLGLERPPSLADGDLSRILAPNSWRGALLRRKSDLSRISAARILGYRRYSPQQWSSPGFWRCHLGETPSAREGVSPGIVALFVWIRWELWRSTSP